MSLLNKVALCIAFGGLCLMLIGGALGTLAAVLEIWRTR